MMLVRANKPKPVYRATEIATEYGHLLYFTPPYHPELQPIELIQAHIKGRIAEDPATSMAELRTKIEAGFDSLVSDTWTNAYRQAQLYGQKYVDLADQCELISESGESTGDLHTDDGTDSE